MKKVIGIIGGMGPLATADLFQKIIAVTDAKNDQEHIRVSIDSNTQIPDRTSAILNGGADPVPEIVKSALRLQGMGADVLIMPCNTAHYFWDRITPFIDVPILNMLHETAKEVIRRGIHSVGLLATDGTIRSEVYKKVFDEYDINMLIPSEDYQKHVMDLIYKGVKAGKRSLNTEGFYQTMDDLFGRGAEVMVLGCTELPVAFQMFQIERPAIDPTLVLARSAVQYVNGGIYAK